MRSSMRSALATFFVATCLAPLNANAQDASCSCATPYQGQSVPVGMVLSSAGNVMILQSAGYVDAAGGSELPLGGRVIAGARSSAVVKVGQGCRLELAENSSLDISLAGKNVCVKVQGPESSTSVLTHNGSFALDGDNLITPVTLFGALALGAGILSVATVDDEDEDGVSP